MKYLKYIAFLLLILSFQLNAQALQKAGDAVKGNYSSPHPYGGSANETIQKVWSQTITLEDAFFVMVHFSRIQLGLDDYLIVKNPDDDRSWTYTNEEITRKGHEFWSINIYGETLEIEIYSKNNSGSYGYDIDLLQKGLPLEELSSSRSICGTDDTQEAVCYQNSQPAAFTASNRVCRLLTVSDANGQSYWGTGWVIGSADHMMTNEHVITSQNEANNTTYDFFAQTNNCGSSCTTQGACSGTIFATSSTFIKDHVNLDYCLVKLPLLSGLSASALYGYLQLRSQGATIGERLYIPQHPSGWGKRIAMVSDNINDPGGLPIIQSKTEAGCGASPFNEVGYWADTRGGSSGSPVIGHTDNLVIALHHCQGAGPGCTNMNRAVPIESIIADLGGLIPPDAVFCPNLLNVTSNVGPNAYDIQSAGTTITASNNLSSTATVQYDAGTTVKLEVGFHAVTGSEFKAYLDGCN